AAAGDDALADGEPLRGHAELLRGQAEQHLGRRRGRGPYPRPGVLDRVARRVLARVGRDRGVGEDELELAQVQVQLLARDHQQPGVGPRPLLDAAGLDRRGVVGVDRDPRVDRVLVDAGARVRVVGGGPAGAGGRSQREPDDERAPALHERLPRERRGLPEAVGPDAPHARHLSPQSATGDPSRDGSVAGPATAGNDRRREGVAEQSFGVAPAAGPRGPTRTSRRRTGVSSPRRAGTFVWWPARRRKPPRPPRAYVRVALTTSEEDTPAATRKMGLRERKKLRTRQTIERVALALFAERGYQATTLAQIAEAAEVVPSTLHAYFPSKDDIVFTRLDATCESARRRILERPGGETVVAALQAWLSEDMPRISGADPVAPELRRRVIDGD